MKRSFFFLILLILAASCKSEEPVKIGSLEFRIAETEAADSLEKAVMKTTGEIFYLHENTGLTAAHVASAKITEWNDSEAIELTFNEEGRKIFTELTGNNIGKQMGIILDGELVSAPVIQAEISIGKALVPLLK